MTRFTEEKISCQKLEKIKTADGEIAGGFASKLRVSIDGMLPGIQNGGQLSGRVQEYEASFTANDNEIYGVKDLSIGNAANTGTVDKDEYVVGEEHKASVYVDDKMHVTMKVENPGGTTNLFMTYTVISKQPIEQGSTHQSENYRVAQDYGHRYDTPNGVVEITDDDDMINASWWMKKHADKHIHELLHGDDQMNAALHHDESNVGAGNMYGKNKKRVGADPKSIVRSMANLVDIKIKLGELSNDNVYLIVEFNGDIFIITISDSGTLQDVKKMIPDMTGQNLATCTIKNQSTGQLLREETECKGISNGQKNRNYFIAPRKNIKWVSIESKANAEA
jgi:hypothetical protein